MTSTAHASTEPQSFAVELGERSYNILVGVRLDEFGSRLDELKAGRKVAIITDTTVGPLYGERLLKSIQSSGRTATLVQMPAGEEKKSIETVNLLYDALFIAELDRSSWVVALGGGVVGDVAGFVAATYMRGIPVVQVPTTIVAQVDAAIGGKTGYNPPHGKNLIGAFHQPRLVYVDPSLLKSLDEREFIAGLAEVVKHGVIADAELFEFMENRADDVLNRVEEALTVIIARSAAYKAYVVSKDEKESGLRATLNYGHTVGHALEKVTGYSTLLHGEGVSIGMDVEARIAVDLGLCEAALPERQKRLLERLGLPVDLPEADLEAVMAAMRLDKKTLDGRLNPVLPHRIGHAEQVKGVEEQVFRRVLAALAHS